MMVWNMIFLFQGCISGSMLIFRSVASSKFFTFGGPPTLESPSKEGLWNLGPDVILNPFEQ